MASDHTAKAFDEDLQELTRLVAEMGGLAERQIVESVDALIRRDVALGKRVVTTDLELDKLQHLIEERAVLRLSLEGRTRWGGAAARRPRARTRLLH